MKKSKSKNKLYTICTGFIYLMLTGALATYFLPFAGIKVPALGEKNWSVRDIVKTIPKIASGQEARRSEFNASFDFMDFIRELLPRGRDMKVERERLTMFVLGAFIPVSLAIVYLSLLLGLFLAVLKKSGPFLIACGLATSCASYVIAGIYYFNSVAHEAFMAAITNAKSTPFFLITEQFVQEVSVQPAYGCLALALLATLLFVTGLVRINVSAKV
jgi:hypothetical protein